MTGSHAKAGAWNNAPYLGGKAGLVGIAGTMMVMMALMAMMIQPARATSFDDGYAAYQQGNFYQARIIWEPLAQAGDTQAMYNVGAIYSEGRGTPRDPLAAELYWSMAADAGHVRAMHNLALSHIARAGSMDEATANLAYQAALVLLENAARDGFANSQYSLGKMYQYGLSVEVDDAIAAEYYALAAEQGFVNAQYNLGKAYRDGRGVTRDMTQSTYFFEQAAEQGHIGAQNRLATRYARGEGVTQDDVTALFWASLAADQGNARAIENRDALLIRMSGHQVDQAAARIIAFTQSP